MNLNRNIDNAPLNDDIQRTLSAHKWVGACHIVMHSPSRQLAAWVELTPEGVDMFRAQGYQAVVGQLTEYLSDQKIIPTHWRFTDQLPYKHCPETDNISIERAYLRVQTDPVWYQCEAVDQNTGIFKGKVPLDLLYFKGHFAHFPLVPGVIEMQWAVDKTMEFFGIRQPIFRVDNLKFQKFLRPNDELELTLKRNEEKHRVEFQLKTDADMCGKGFVIFTAEE